jgi:hypothetical protein
MTSSAYISTSSHAGNADSGAASSSIRVARAFGGRGYVVVDGLLQLRTAIERSGTARVTLEGTLELLTLRRNAEGDLVLVEGTPSP